MNLRFADEFQIPCFTLRPYPQYWLYGMLPRVASAAILHSLSVR